MHIAKKIALFLGDLVLLYGALILTLLTRYGAPSVAGSFAVHLIPFSLIFIIWMFIFFLSDLYDLRTIKTSGEGLKKIASTTSIAIAASICMFYLFSGLFELTPKTNLFIFGAWFFVLDSLFRTTFARLLERGGHAFILLGETPLIAPITHYLAHNMHTGYHLVSHNISPSWGDIESLKSLVETQRVDTIVATPALIRESSSLMYSLLNLEINIVPLTNFYEMLFNKTPLEEISEDWFVENLTLHRPLYDRVKRCMDWSASALLILLLSPLMVFVALLITLTSRGSVLYIQERIGKHGVPFMLYKFRTMFYNNNGPLWTIKDDERITTIGKILRFTHLDELPQLFNIFKGNISFIGPRPERTELVNQYRAFANYDMRHIIKPGLTGWAQINFRPSASLEEAQEKLCYDIYYIKHRSFFLDILILLKTIRYVFIPHS